MKTVVNYRACGILYNFLKANSITGKVLIPANICETVPATYMKAGMDIAFFDISKKDFMPDIYLLYNILQNDKTVTVLHYNHTYGYLDRDSNKQLFCSIKNRFPKIIIVDDRCLCKPSINDTDCFADLCMYSTGNVKYVDIGYGGFAHVGDGFNYVDFPLVYNKQAEIEFDKHIKQSHAEHCSVDKHIMLGAWLNNSGIDSEILNSEVKKLLNETESHKSKINQIYSVLRGKLSEKYNDWRFQILVENQEECLRAIFDNGLFASKHYMSLGNDYFDSTKTPNAEWLEAHVINLFNDFRFSIEQARQLVDVLNSVMVPIEASI